jgi:SAM-dependent methyltransferase
MKPDFTSFLQCPARDCGGADLRLHAEKSVTVQYKDGPAEEVREGRLECPSCGRRYPISEYVPSFEQLYPEELQREAEYWGRWYGFMWKRGYLGYFDLRAPMAPLITEGIEVLDPATLDHKDLGGTHSIIAGHPALKNAEWLLDIGCGTGWSSLYFARQGHKVVGFDPAVANMRLAKRYAISQHEYVEYMGAAMGFLQFKPAVFDGAVALHSIHHVPNLRSEMAILRGWLKDGAAMGIDEHVRNDEVLSAIIAATRKWAEEEVYPKVRTLPPGVLEGLPRSEPSAMEGAGSEDVIGAFLDNFEVETFQSRYITLDSLSFIYYLSHLPARAAYDYAGNVIHHIYSFLMEAYPDGAEYAILIGRKAKDGEKPPANEFAERARTLSRGEANLIKHQLQIAQEDLLATDKMLAGAHNVIKERDQLILAKNRHIEQLERWAHSLERDLRAAEKSPLARARKRVSRLMRRK